MNYFYATSTAKFDIYKLERQLHTYQLNTLNDLPKSKMVGFDSHSIEMIFNTKVPFFKQVGGNTFPYRDSWSGSQSPSKEKLESCGSEYGAQEPDGLT